MPDMNCTIAELRAAVVSAAERITSEQPAVWRMSEWNICHHLAIELGKTFADFNIDVELVKDDGRRPDIVIHERDTHDRNLAVFQVKVRPSAQDVVDDLGKISGTFFREPYHYKYGVFLSVGKLPAVLPEFDSGRVVLVPVDGRRRMTAEEEAKIFKPYSL